MRSTRIRLACFGLLAGSFSIPACGADGRDEGGLYGDGAGDGGGDDGGGDDGGNDDGGDDGSGGDDGGSGDDGGDDGGGDAKFDVGTDGDVPGAGCNDPDGECEGCTGVDIVFVVDNSGSMQDHQMSLGQAFPQFTDAIINALPPGTSVHVGVTSTEMGYASSGSTSNCFAVNGDASYITPDVMPSGRNGAQGRLYETGGKTYYEFSTDDPPAVIQDVKDWFVGAANIGTGGSNIEMSCAAAGWVGDPANDATNAGFIRDEGAVLVVFFVQDEPDQTPGSVGGQAMLDKLIARKAGCGGANCIIAGGLVNTGCLPMVPLGEFFDGLPDPPVVQALPFIGGVDPSMYIAILEGTLAGVIAQKCEEIPPVG